MTKQHTKLPVTTDEMEDHLGKLFREEGIKQGMAFQPRRTDIIVTPYPKCGTTWLQQVTHGLRTRGRMDFEEITVVTPWIELSSEVGWDLDAEQVAEPRIYKSHLSWTDVPKNARYIVSFRDPASAFLSFYRFFEGFMFERGAIDLDTFFHWDISPAEMGERGYWHHLASWWEQRDNPDVLLFCYEDMLVDFEGTVRRVAAFMDIPLDDALLDCVMHQASREFMLAHKNQFDDAPLRRLIAERTGVRVNTDAAKVTSGARDDPKYQLTPEHKDVLAQMWHEHVSERFGLQSYEDLRDAVRVLHEG